MRQPTRPDGYPTVEAVKYMGKLLAEGNTQALDLLGRVPTPPFPGGRWLRWPLTVAGLSWYALRDRL
ncbi:MAG: hypothetical protein B7Z12_05745 [Caulobacter vibrioides]|uniref:Uncharacterized protein n=1 Tax=Caulobacter vibrioides TaxID=155892 RepID=A0A258DAR3_CAUVI|nr:MAG: hypothetical protein B7Z12_05745 [Caulobacter vibrioides]